MWRINAWLRTLTFALTYPQSHNSQTHWRPFSFKRFWVSAEYCLDKAIFFLPLLQNLTSIKYYLLACSSQLDRSPRQKSWLFTLTIVFEEWQIKGRALNSFLSFIPHLQSLTNVLINTGFTERSIPKLSAWIEVLWLEAFAGVIPLPLTTASCRE